MSSPPPPKALLFDIGGVCVLSPFRAILDYEHSKSIPPGWVNFAISASKPDGYWHRLERGELVLGPEFFDGFRKDLTNGKLWRQHCVRSKKRRAAAGESEATKEKEETMPPVPDVDVEWLMEAILRISRTPDPHMYPALKMLNKSGRFLMAALSNTMALPDDHFANQPHEEGDVRAIFDPFVSSAHSGLRKPEPRAYTFALEKMQEKWRSSGQEGDLTAGDVMFIDDIGENLKGGKAAGFRTIKVVLGQTQEAVKELEKVTGMSLIEDTAKL